ncbi:MAG: lytic transglycosylase domain-containing protein, partial [Pseudomonadota bacterium]
KSGTKATRKISGPKSGGKGKYDRLIAKYARQHGVPYKLARAVVQVESTFRPHVTGAAGEIGLMQIKLATARGMGYKGSRKALYDPATNLYWGMKYLGRAHQLASGSTCGTILKYNAGHGAERMNKISARYCGRVQRILA